MSADPAEGNRGPIVVFDGICVLCNGWVRFLLKRDRGRHRFAAMQSTTGSAILLEHGLDPQDPVSFLLVEDGRASTDTDAIVRVLGSLGRGWRLAAHALERVPAILRDRAYRALARNRYRWFGTTACHVPTPAQRSRFLD